MHFEPSSFIYLFIGGGGGVSKFGFWSLNIINRRTKNEIHGEYEREVKIFKFSSHKTIELMSDSGSSDHVALIRVINRS